jgi:hypothetical protein
VLEKGGEEEDAVFLSPLSSQFCNDSHIRKVLWYVLIKVIDRV